jgi:pyruvate/2-oxoglutarate dehydrogenase complex dihydrolipoamide dehydrogenase (E3) component
MSGDRFDVAVIGGGSGGLSVAAAAAQFGQKVVLFEKSEMGGECLNTGCVPSKALLAAGKHAYAMRDAARYGIAPVEPRVDFQGVMSHVQRAIETIAPHDSEERFTGLGVRVVRAAARFCDARTLEAGGQRFQARRVVIATGSRPAIPPIPGLDGVRYLTNETLFANTVLPSHLIIIGAGPQGLEMAQAHRRLGARVTVVDAGPPLAGADPELAAPLLEQLGAEEIDILAGTAIARAFSSGDGIGLELASGRVVTGSHLLVAAGRRPNTEGLGLEEAGIRFTPRGIVVDERFRTSNRSAYAIGDVAGGRSTHEAGYQAGLVIRHMLFGLPVTATAAIPRVTYTDPELAEAGLGEKEARAHFGKALRVLRQPFHGNDRAVAEGQPKGLVKVMVGRRGRILGVALVGPEAGELIQPWLLAMGRGLKVSAMAGQLLPYPTRGEAGRKAAMEYFRDLASNRLLRAVIRLMRAVRP